MKKLLFILSAIFVSVMGWAQLNPYAYGLSSNWNATDQKLTVNFNLNDKANKITIFSIDSENANNKFTIYEGNPGDKIDFSGNNGVVIKFDGRKFKNQNGVDACLVAGKKIYLCDTSGWRQKKHTWYSSIYRKSPILSSWRGSEQLPRLPRLWCCVCNGVYQWRFGECNMGLVER